MLYIAIPSDADELSETIFFDSPGDLREFLEDANDFIGLHIDPEQPSVKIVTAQ